MQHNFSNKDGFTLVELVVVIMIIGLIVSGVLVGQSIIKSSELQQIASNFSNYRTAMKQFQDKYKYLPGDFPSAESYWGSRVCSDTASDDMAQTTCNGNGDGFITGVAGTPLALGADYYEGLTVWQHLANAELIKGAYSGRAGVSVTWWKPGTNIPMGQVSSAGYGINYAGTGSVTAAVSDATLGAGTATSFAANYRHVITYGTATSQLKTQTPTTMSLSPADAVTIDAKIDDGKPAFGNVLTAATTFDSDVTYQCVSTNVASTSAYLTTTTPNKCTLFFITGM